MRKTGLTDHDLCAAVSEMELGLIEADLGGHVFKKRVALPGRGKRGSARTIVATNRSNRWFFIFGFEKNEKDNISDKELESLQGVAAALLARTKAQLDGLVAADEIKEICDDEEI